jgi:23S rRNA (adenine2030-N6)-methyltransferase
LFSYRHGFHAGNHADVLKHALLLSVMTHLQQKDTGLVLVDTHAGAGLYDLSGVWANKRSEYLDGIGRLWSATHAPVMIQRYLDSVRELNPDQTLTLYPGSPWLMLQMARPQDKLRLYEILPAEIDVLSHNLSQQRRIPARNLKLLAENGFTALRAVLPPPSRRALVLIDPAYENKHDYRDVVQALKDALIRFATGCYLIWYPRVNRLQVEQMIRQIQHLPGASWLQAELTVRSAPADQHGLFGSGVLVINPPYTLKQELHQALPWLKTQLQQDERAQWLLRTSDDPKPSMARKPQR